MFFEILDLGLIDFLKAAAIQKETLDAVRIGIRKSALILCQHYPVITLGRQAKVSNIKAPLSLLQDKGIQICKVERGGDITYHGPGQLIAYPVFNLNFFYKDIHWFLRNLEKTIIDLLTDFKIKGKQKSGLTGAWVGDKKISSIGIAVKNWITFHGLSINLTKDGLGNFELIRPCGMDIKMTSLENELKARVDIKEVKFKLIARFNAAFIIQPQQVLSHTNP